MRWLIFSIALSGFAAHSLGPVYSVGLGVEMHTAPDVNPDDTTVPAFGQIYGEVDFRPWSILAEIGTNGGNTSSVGNYSVTASTFNLMTWGRYEPWSLDWSPYFGVGLGWGMEHVSSTFGSANDDRWADGGMKGGLSTGVLHTFYQHWRIEGELRLIKSEFVSDLSVGFALRTGYVF